jgi:dihydropteroate synthase
VRRGVETFRRVLARARAGRGLALMGVCNVTPDSFSDGGLFLAPDAARARVDALLAEGADFIDVGGESTKPGARPVPASEQMARVLDVVRYAVGVGACVSVDTTSAEVAAVCLDQGASVVNDVSCLRESSLGGVVARAGAALILMHTRGLPQEMTGFGAYPAEGYEDVVREVCAEWRLAAEKAGSLGVPVDAIVMDPGLGFAKSAEQSVELLSRVGEIVESVEVPVAVGASRKSFLSRVDPGALPDNRLGASVAAALHAARSGVAILRVHDVRATRQAVDLARLLGGR